MKSGLEARMDRLFNRHGDGRAVCVAADHGYMCDVTPNVVGLRPILEAVVRGGADGVLLSPGQAMRLNSYFQGRDGPALLIRADWSNMPRLGTANVANAAPQRLLYHQKMITAEQALALGATAITVFLFLGYSDRVEADGVESCARFAAECRQAGLPLIIEPLALGGHVTGANRVEMLKLGARISVELGANALKVPYTGDVETFRELVETVDVPVLVLGGARSDDERDSLEIVAEGLEAGGSGCLMGRNVTKSPDPQKLIEQLCRIAHQAWSVARAMRGEVWRYIRLKADAAKCTGCELCMTACVAQHTPGSYGTHLSRLRVMRGENAVKHTLRFCTLCGQCIEACPEEALRWNPSHGGVELLLERCTACGACVSACPTGVILHSDEAVQVDPDVALDWYPIVCDLCGGEPECARTCPSGAIFVAERKEREGWI